MFRRSHYKKAPAIKACIKCGEEKPNTSEFYGKVHAYTNRLRTVCKKCRK